MPTVEVIIPTACEPARWSSLQRAISSIQTQVGVEAKIIVVVNGSRFDQQCFTLLKAMPGLTVTYQERGSAPLAQRYGRTLVSADYFGFLDDDDEYLPDALKNRVAPMLADQALDFVVSNGYRTIDGREGLAVTDPKAVKTAPLEALIYENWLASCAGLFRTATIGAECFEVDAHYFEWTVLAYRLASMRKMAFVDPPGFRINESAVSLSKSMSYRHAEVVVLSQILDMDLPRAVRKALRRKLGRAYHNLAENHYSEGKLTAAWRCHLTSMLLPGGWSYLLFSRKLVPILAN